MWNFDYFDRYMISQLYETMSADPDADGRENGFRKEAIVYRDKNNLKEFCMEKLLPRKALCCCKMNR